MGQIVIDDLDSAVYEKLAAKAAASQTSIAEVAKGLLSATVDPKRAALLRRMDAIRAMSARSEFDSTQLIREDRDAR